MGPEEFIEHFLVRHIRPCCVVEGEDFNFGAKRAGDVEFLRQSGKEHGFEVEVVEAEKIEIPGDDVLKVSSTLIRYMLEGGEVSDAAFALGRCYKLIGQVVSGRGKGKELGFPTINMAIGSQMIVQEGVYAGRIGIADNKQGVCQAKAETNAIFSIGQARTFGEDIDLLVEAHVLNGNFEVKQGAWMAMDFVDRIRPQHKFASEEDLVEQIIRDCAQAEKMLKKGKF
jgi:riboflavin kinase/FMN adenylyltransferase